MTTRCNFGKTERIVRIVASLVLVALRAGWWPYLYLLGALIFAMALVTWCPISAILRISNCREVDQEEIPVDSASTGKDRLIREHRFK